MRRFYFASVLAVVVSLSGCIPVSLGTPQGIPTWLQSYQPMELCHPPINRTRDWNSRKTGVHFEGIPNNYVSGKIRIINEQTNVVTDTDLPYISARIPAVSPNGSKFAYVGQDGLYIANTNGSNSQRIYQLSKLNQESGISNLAWSPTQDLIAFDIDGGVFGKIGFISSDGSFQTGSWLTTSGIIPFTSTELQYPSELIWSKDGTLLIFFAFRKDLQEGNTYILERGDI